MLDDGPFDTPRSVPMIRRGEQRGAAPPGRNGPWLAINFGAELVLQMPDADRVRPLRLERDAVLCLPPGEPLPLPWGDAPTLHDEPLGANLLWVQVRPAVFRQAARRLGLGVDVGAPVRRRVLRLDATARLLAQALEHALAPGSDASAALIEQIGTALAAWLIEHRRDGSIEHELAEATHEAIGRAVLHIHSHAEAGLSIARLAEEAGLSVFQFIRAFKARMGTTPYQYLMAERVARAQQLIAANLRARRRQRLCDLALEAGFASHSRLIECFQRVAGCSPSEWQKRLSIDAATQQRDSEPRTW